VTTDGKNPASPMPQFADNATQRDIWQEIARRLSGHSGWLSDARGG
jgi:hypothetical protein